MSVINRVLKDLDRKAEHAPFANPAIRSVSSASAAGSAPGLASITTPRTLIVSGLVLGLAAVGWWLWWYGQPTTPETAQQAPVELDEPTHPLQPADIAVPQLRLSNELSMPADKGTAQASAAASFKQASAPPAPVAIRMAPKIETRPAVQPAQKTAPSAEPASVAPPVEAATPKSQVIKENRPPSNAEQAETLWQRNQGRSSQATLEQVLQLDPAHLRARQALVVLTLGQARQDIAEGLLREGLRLHPNEFWFPRSLAQLHLQQGNDAQAAADLSRSIGKNASAADWALYASTLAKLGRHDDCANAYREALRRDGSQGTWWVGLGVALERSGHKSEAAEAYQRATSARLSEELKTFATQKAQDLK